MSWYEILPRVLNMSVTASIIILFVLLCRFFLKRAPKKYSYILWIVVFFRLVCPLSLSAPISLLGLFHVPVVALAEEKAAEKIENIPRQSWNMTSFVEYIPSDIVHTENPQIVLPITGTDGVISQIVNESLPKGEEQLIADPLEAPITLATYLWIFGLFVMIGKGVMSYFRLHKQLIGAIHYKSNIYIADYIPTPFVLGIIKPKIYLPSSLDEKAYKYIILHEEHHIHRGDTVFKILAYLALCIHWFNPLVCLAFHSFVKDMEMSCDEAVIKKLGASIRADYAASILEFASGQKVLFGAPLAFGEGEPAGRIKNLFRWKKPTVIASAIAVIVCVLVVIICMFNPMEGNDSEQFEEMEISIESTEDEKESNIVTALPSKEEVLTMREKVLEGMSDEEIERLRENIKVANLAMERAYLNDNLFEKLSDKNSPYWLYFDQKGEIQLGWWYKQGIFSKEEIMKAENITEEEFAEKYTEPGTVYNRFDAENFITLISDMQTSVHNEELISDLQQLIDLTYLAKATHEMEYANAIYRILHDMDYFLLRYGIEDVGKYTNDTGTVSKYYGVLVVYGAEAFEARIQMPGSLITNQAYEVTLNDWGKVTFAAVAPENDSFQPNGLNPDVRFCILEDEKVIYDFPGWNEENTNADLFLNVSDIAFEDYNDDGLLDVITLCKYETISGQRFQSARVYFQLKDKQGFEENALLTEYLSKNSRTDSIDSIMEAKEEWWDYLSSMDGHRSYYNQLMIMAENKELWAKEMEYANDEIKYAVSDLDRNGRYEIIVANTGGRGFYTYSRYYEINETYDGLVECKTDFLEGDSQPDIITEQWKTYVDAQGMFYYAVYDYVRNGAAEYYGNIRSLSLQNGKIETVPIAYKSTYYREDSTEEYFTDSVGNSISEDDYYQAEEHYFAGCQEFTTCFGWQDMRELPESVTEIFDKLDASRMVFCNSY